MSKESFVNKRDPAHRAEIEAQREKREGPMPSSFSKRFAEKHRPEHASEVERRARAEKAGKKPARAPAE